jgi:hypothetical protein
MSIFNDPPHRAQPEHPRGGSEPLVKGAADPLLFFGSEAETPRTEVPSQSAEATAEPDAVAALFSKLSWRAGQESQKPQNEPQTLRTRAQGLLRADSPTRRIPAGYLVAIPLVLFAGIALMYAGPQIALWLIPGARTAAATERPAVVVPPLPVEESPVPGAATKASAGAVATETPTKKPVPRGQTREATGRVTPVARASRGASVDGRGNSAIDTGLVMAPAVPTQRGALSVNARPWADVWIDGRMVGTTPIGNVQLTVGSHEVVWRHPELGERRQTVQISVEAPTRVGIDLRNP